MGGKLIRFLRSLELIFPNWRGKTMFSWLWWWAQVTYHKSLLFHLELEGGTGPWKKLLGFKSGPYWICGFQTSSLWNGENQLLGVTRGEQEKGYVRCPAHCERLFHMESVTFSLTWSQNWGQQICPGQLQHLWSLWHLLKFQWWTLKHSLFQYWGDLRGEWTATEAGHHTL